MVYSAVAMLMFYCLLLLTTSPLHDNLYIGNVVCVLVYALVYMVSLWLFGMNSYEKNIVLGALKFAKKKMGY